MSESKPRIGALNCRKCFKLFTVKRNRTRHEKACGQPKLFLCTWPHCQKTFARSDNLSAHKKTHRRYRCADCGVKGFYLQTDLAAHRAKYHSRCRPVPKDDDNANLVLPEEDGTKFYLTYLRGDLEALADPEMIRVYVQHWAEIRQVFDETDPVIKSYRFRLRLSCGGGFTVWTEKNSSLSSWGLRKTNLHNLLETPIAEKSSPSKSPLKKGQRKENAVATMGKAKGKAASKAKKVIPKPKREQIKSNQKSDEIIPRSLFGDAEDDSADKGEEADQGGASHLAVEEERKRAVAIEKEKYSLEVQSASSGGAKGSIEVNEDTFVVQGLYDLHIRIKGDLEQKAPLMITVTRD